MQNKKLKHEYVLISVPAELLLEAGICEGEIMEMYVAGKKLIIQNADESDGLTMGGI